MAVKVFPLIVFLFFICTGQAAAGVCAAGLNFNNYYYPNGLASATGTIVGLARNSITILDEEQKSPVRLVFFSQGENFHQGDYVRAYYYPQNGVVQSIKKMTTVVYKNNGQNMGYICRLN